MSARPHLEAFEPRLLYSADALSLGLGASAFPDGETAWTQSTSALAVQNLTTARGVEIVVVDSSLADAAALLSDLAAQQSAGRALEVLTLKAGDDGIARISELLAQRNNIAALHVLGHGADGLVVLGGVQLNSASVLARAGEIAAWGRAFSADGDFLIYGCDVAAGSTGAQLVNDLAALTGADVAASTDTTASDLRGGNWRLEAQAGTIESASALRSETQQNYQGSLLTYAVTRFTDDNNPGSLRHAITQANTGSGADTITLSAGTYLLTLPNVGVDGANGWRDLDIASDVTIVGAGAGQTVIESQGSWRHFEVNSGSLNLSGVTLRGGSQTSTDTSNEESRGGSINVRSGATLVLSQTVIENSSAQNGGAIYVAGTATLTDVELRSNTARNDGGAIYDAGNTTLSRVTVAQNLAMHSGGGIYKNSAQLTTLSNLTLSGNWAAFNGGGLYSYAGLGGGTSGSNSGPGNDKVNVQLVNASVVNNAALGSGGGLFLAADTQASVANSLFATNTSVTTVFTHANQNLSSLGNNLFDLVGGGSSFGMTKTGDQPASDVQVAALANNGGLTRTHALASTSAAVNAVSATSLTPAPSTDQRNVARQGKADIGAFEYINATPYFGNAVLTIGAGGTVAPMVDVLDAEGDSIAVDVVSVTHGRFVQSSNPLTAIANFAASDFLDGKIRFVHDGSAFAPTFTLRARDSLSTSADKVGTVYFTPPNSTPVASALTLGGIAEDSARTVTQSQLLANASDANGDPLFASNLRLQTPVNGSLTTQPASGAIRGFGIGTGLKGEYFNNTSFAGNASVTRLETIDFNWGTGAPVAALATDHFTVRWTGYVVAPTSGNYVFRTESDDGMRVWVNGNLVIDKWSTHQTQAYLSNPITLTAGGAYAIKVEYFEEIGAATARLQWQTPGSGTFSAIPTARLFDAVPAAMPEWRFTPSPNYNGTVNFLYDVSDGRGGMVAALASMVVTPVNDAPVMSNNRLTVTEGGTATPVISATDPDNPLARTLTFTASSINNGYFVLSTNTANPITQFTQQQINDGVVRFVHNGSSNAPSYRLKVSDGNLSSATTQSQISFTAVNDAPQFVANTLSIANGGVALPGIVVTDEESAAANLMLTVSALSGGQFELDGFTGSAITSFSLAQVNAGAVRFAHDGLGSAPSYRLTVTDQGGVTAFKDVTAALSAHTPVLLNNSLAVSEGGEVIPNIQTTDSQDSNSLLRITVTELQGGFFSNIAAPGSAVYSFLQSDVDSSLIRFTHDGLNAKPSYRLTVTDPDGASTSSLADVTFTAVNDAPNFILNALSITQGGSAAPSVEAIDEESPSAQLVFTVTNLSGGYFELTETDGSSSVLQFTQAQIDSGHVRFVDGGSGLAPAYSLSVSDGMLSSAAIPVNIQRFTLLNDRPVFTKNSLTISEGGSATPQIAISDPDHGSDQLLIAVSDLVGGHFEFNTSSVGGFVSGGLGDVVEKVASYFTLAQYKAGQISFVHDGSELTPSYTLTVTDSDGAFDASAVSNVVFTPVNDLPIFSANSLVISEGAYAMPNIRASDEDNSAAQLTIYVTTSSGGRFELTGNPGQAVASFTQWQLNQGEVRFVDSGLGSAPAYSLALSDPALRSAETKTALPRSVGDIIFTAVNDAPVFTSNALVITEGGVTRPSINVTDEDHSAAQLTLTVSALSGGRFEFTRAEGVAITTFTQADLNEGSVRFVHDGSETTPAYALRVVDVEAAQATSSGPALAYTPVNDAAVILNNQLRIVEAGFAVPTIQVSDIDTPATLLNFTVSAVSGGHFELIGAPGMGIAGFNQAQLDAGVVRFVHDGSFDAPSYTLALSDDNGDDKSDDKSHGNNVQSSTAAVTFTRLPPAPAALLAVNTAASPSTGSTTATDTRSAALTKPTNTSAADVLASRAAAAAAEAATAESAATEAQAQAQMQANALASATSQSGAAPSSASWGDGRGGAVRGATPTSTSAGTSTGTNNAGGVVEADSRWASAAAASSAINVQNLLLIADASALDWSSSSSSLLDRKLLDAVLGSSDSSVRNTALDKAFERIREELDQGAQADGQAVAGSLVLSTSFSVGYVLWLARGGVLLASMASSIPAWATVDPLPVLSRFKSRHGESDDGLGGPDGEVSGDKTDALERLFSKAKKVFSGNEGPTPPPAPPAPPAPPPPAPPPAPTPPHSTHRAPEASGVTP